MNHVFVTFVALITHASSWQDGQPAISVWVMEVVAGGVISILAGQIVVSIQPGALTRCAE
jgi:hypothetical protein